MRRTVPVFVLVAVMLFAALLTGCGSGSSGSSSSSSGSSSSQRSFPLSSLAQTDVVLNGDTFRVYVMDTPEKRAEGMMFLADGDIGADEGMLFVFPSSQYRRFWMRNTAIPLDIAYLDSDKRIVTIAQMVPFDETGVESAAPAQYALEFKQGTLARHTIVPGMAAQIPDTITSR